MLALFFTEVYITSVLAMQSSNFNTHLNEPLPPYEKLWNYSGHNEEINSLLAHSVMYMPDERFDRDHLSRKVDHKCIINAPAIGFFIVMITLSVLFLYFHVTMVNSILVLSFLYAANLVLVMGMFQRKNEWTQL